MSTDSYNLLIFVYAVGVAVSACITENRDDAGRFHFWKSLAFWLLSFPGIIYILSKDFNE